MTQLTYNEAFDPYHAAFRFMRLHLACDQATEGLIYFMIVFSPWAFGATEPWPKAVMDAAGYLLGGLLAMKWLLRGSGGWLAAS